MLRWGQPSPAPRCSLLPAPASGGPAPPLPAGAHRRLPLPLPLRPVPPAGEERARRGAAPFGWARLGSVRLDEEGSAGAAPPRPRLPSAPEPAAGAL